MWPLNYYLAGMFIEPHMGGREKTGWIEVICGCMFSGKTEELIRRLNRALIAQQKVEYLSLPLIKDIMKRILFLIATAP